MEVPVLEPLPLRFDRAGLARPTFQFARRLAISEPCACIFSSHVSLSEWGVNYTPVNVFDKIEGYRELWTHFFGEALANQFRCGREGDLLQFPLAGLQDCDGLIGGPPCPPWAANGKRKGCADVRSLVYDRLVEWIAHLALRGQLLFFAIENATGILSAASAAGQGSQRYVDWVMNSFEKRIPFFSVTYHVVDTSTLTPQRRKRCWVIGVRNDVLRGQPIPSPLPIERLPKIHLADLLNQNVQKLRPDALEPRLRKNLADYMGALLDQVRGKKWSGAMVGIFDLDRGFGKGWKPNIAYDEAPTFTTKTTKLFVASLTDLDIDPLDRMYHRFLAPHERLAMQGHGPAAAQILGESALVKACGNAFPVPMVGTVVVPILEIIHDSGLVKEGRATRLSLRELRALA